jgi:hypothetical protein
LSLSRILLCVFALAFAWPAAAQETRWEPLGAIPVDQAGAGRRGYVLAPEGADVTQPGTDQISVHAVAGNNIYREQLGADLISQRFETHTLALAYRHGFKIGRFPQFEIGGQVQLNERDSGFLNGFISGFEDVWTSVTGATSAKNPLRANAALLPPLGTFITVNGRPSYAGAGSGSGFGDASLVVKALLHDGASPGDTRVAARLVVNVAGKPDFTEGNFAGVGVSLDKRLLSWAAFHGDVRATMISDQMSAWNLPLKRTAFGYSAGSELKITRNSSFVLQVDGGNTPYQPTGTVALDAGYGDVTLGVNHRFRAGTHSLITQVYARENMNLPFSVRQNTDPDLAVGIKTTIALGSR